MLDRFLVLCESSEVTPLIVINKTDLLPPEGVAERFRIYREIGYELLPTSVKTGEGIEALRAVLAQGTSALTGPSGVGKSSLLNRLQPGLGLRVGAVSAAVNKGQHTTVTAEMIRLDGGGYVADTPGLREIGLWDVPSESLDFCFPEFAPYLGECRYGSSCTHSHEPGCKVAQAADAGLISPSRFGSYLRLLAGDDLEE
jgi:ribosome biogenesis GTPase